VSIDMVFYGHRSLDTVGTMDASAITCCVVQWDGPKVEGTTNRKEHAFRY